MAAPVLSFTTDFGRRDPYVGIMEAVVLSLAPNARVLHLAHDLPPFHVPSAALSISGSFTYCPAGSIHVVVVDPGVGSDRAPIAVEGDGHRFVGPDNGVFSAVIDRCERVRAVELAEPRYWRAEVSPTFHGRDIFAPVAAHLARGITFEELGPTRRVESLVRGWPEVRPEPDGGWAGEVVCVDRFGNAITNLRPAPLRGIARLSTGTGAGQSLPVVGHYAEVAVGGALALVGSYGYLEISVREGDAARRFRISPGTPVAWTPN